MMRFTVSGSMLSSCKKTSVADPAQLCKRRIPACYDESPDTAYFTSTSKDKYRVIYFECIDVLATTIETRFN